MEQAQTVSEVIDRDEPMGEEELDAYLQNGRTLVSVVSFTRLVGGMPIGIRPGKRTIFRHYFTYRARVMPGIP